MAVGFGAACPKPEKRSTAKGRVQRHASTVVQQVRAQCVARDGDCRVPQWDTTLPAFGQCSGESEWAHMSSHRRSKTRGQSAEARHTTAGSLMLCTRHHQLYDEHRLTIEPLTADGADGTLRMRRGGVSVLSLPGAKC